jgi:hypothetical protein
LFVCLAYFFSSLPFCLLPPKDTTSEISGSHGVKIIVLSVRCAVYSGRNWPIL